MKRLWQIIILAIGVVTAVFLSQFFSLPTQALAMTMQSGADAARGTDQITDLFGTAGIFGTITNILLFLVGAISVLMIIFGGFRYIISGGNSTNVSAAKNTILYAIVGLVVAILAYAVINFVITSFVGGGGGGGFSGGTNT